MRYKEHYLFEVLSNNYDLRDYCCSLNGIKMNILCEIETQNRCYFVPMTSEDCSSFRTKKKAKVRTIFLSQGESNVLKTHNVPNLSLNELRCIIGDLFKCTHPKLAFYESIHRDFCIKKVDRHSEKNVFFCAGLGKELHYQ